jgi:hypothetical protein
MVIESSVFELWARRALFLSFPETQTGKFSSSAAHFHRGW